ncbi:MAG: hypothetical protein CBB79_05880 [Synechococcus sp. TMED19]|nr:MAG: hypothetical protein CBB79_05880 [Synechococcus sp. TMED19]
MSAHPANFSAIVRGAGPTGSLAALAMARAGWQVTLYDPSDTAALMGRRRAYAITHSSCQLLQKLGLWGAVAPHCHPFDRLELLDLGSRSRTAFAVRDAVGWIVEHQALQKQLLQACNDQSGLQLSLGEEASIASDRDQLTVIAEGGGSPSRLDLGIGFPGFRYRQGCLTALVQLDRQCSPTTAWEVFRPEGPLAVLPLGKGRTQVVWSAPQQQCEQRTNLSDKTFLEQLNNALPSEVTAIGLHDQPAWFPVEWRIASRLGRGTTLLCGESAHRCHPVGGQGLNLCWRDVETLARLASDRHCDARSLVRRYSRRRWLDLLGVLLATDGLVRLFSNRNQLLIALRRWGISLLNYCAPLRRLSLNLATYGPKGILLTTGWQQLNNQRS